MVILGMVYYFILFRFINIPPRGFTWCSHVELAMHSKVAVCLKNRRNVKLGPLFMIAKLVETTPISL